MMRGSGEWVETIQVRVRRTPTLAIHLHRLRMANGTHATTAG